MIFLYCNCIASYRREPEGQLADFTIGPTFLSMDTQKVCSQSRRTWLIPLQSITWTWQDTRTDELWENQWRNKDLSKAAWVKNSVYVLVNLLLQPPSGAIRLFVVYISIDSWKSLRSLIRAVLSCTLKRPECESHLIVACDRLWIYEMLFFSSFRWKVHCWFRCPCFHTVVVYSNQL
jgi:hypothetical protein